MPKSHPISFTAEMVRAILAGRKTQTRRVVTQHNSLIDGTGEGIKAHWPHLELERAWVDRGPSPAGNPGPYLKAPCNWLHYCEDVVHRVYPRWQVGDRLWVRETWGAVWPGETDVPLEDCNIEYRADLPPGCDDYPGSWPAEQARECPYDAPRWRPSIHMPRWASRITLEVTGVRVERVQDASTEDIIAEGCPKEYLLGRNWFQPLWDSINAKRGYGWDVNPWVWVLEFERKEPDNE